MTEASKRKRKSYEWWLQMMLFVISMVMLIYICLSAFGIPRNDILIHTHEQKARVTAIQLQQATTTFFVEYSRYPTRKTFPSPDPEAIHYSDSELTAVLMGAETIVEEDLQNPRMIPFFSGRKASQNRNSGVTTNSDGSHEIFDPWGNHYRVIMDTNGDNRITPPAWTGLKDPIRKNVLVWSPGPDGKDETAKDNITSW